MLVAGSLVTFSCRVVRQWVLQNLSNMVFITCLEMLFASTFGRLVPKNVFIIHLAGPPYRSFLCLCSQIYDRLIKHDSLDKLLLPKSCYHRRMLLNHLSLWLSFSLRWCQLISGFGGTVPTGSRMKSVNSSAIILTVYRGNDLLCVLLRSLRFRRVVDPIIDLYR